MCWCTALAAAPVAGVRCPPPSPRRSYLRRGSSIRAEAPPGGEARQKKVAVAGAGWAGLAAAHHLVKQGYEVTLFAADSGPTEEVGLRGISASILYPLSICSAITDCPSNFSFIVTLHRGFWYPYRNIFSLVDELGISPFTGWTKAAYYSPQGLAAEFPVFHDQPRLPAPFGIFAYPEFRSLPLIDRLTSIPILSAVIDFDNTDTAWRKYDTMTARELLKMFGCSQRLYKEVFEPAIQASLFAPGEQCSAAATLGMLYYYMLSHQENSDFVLCRGEVEDTIFSPWLKSLELKGLKFVANRVPTSLMINKDTECVSGVVCGEEVYDTDAFVSAAGLSPLQSIIQNSPLLQLRQEFTDLLYLSTIDVISVKLWFDKKVTIPKVANICSSFDDLSGWTFFDLTSVYDDYSDESGTVVEAEFYNATHLLPLNDQQIISEASSRLIKCIRDFEGATVIQQFVRRSPRSAMHFLPGSYKHTVRGTTSVPNLFIAGDWIVNRHGSFSKEKAYVTGLEAANMTVDFFGDGDFAKIIAVEGDEPHIETVRDLNRRANELKTQIPFSEFFLQ